MSNTFYKVSIYFSNSRDVATLLMSEHDADVVGNCVVKQCTAYNLEGCNWKTFQPEQVVVVNGRNVDYVTMEEYSNGAVV